VNLTSLIRTTAFRLALRHVLVYVCLMGVFLVALFWSSHLYIDSKKVAGLEEELDRLTERFETEGPQSLLKELSESKERRLKKGRYYLLVGPDGTKIAGNLLAWPSGSNVPVDGKMHSIWLEDSVIPDSKYNDDAFGPVIARELPDGSRLLLARNVRHVEELEDITLYLMPIILAFAALLALAMGVTLSRTILRRVDAISRTAGEIMAGKLSRRIQVSDRDDEFSTLGRRLNAMLDRVQQLVTGMREVTDHVAHDLRSPLSRARNRLEVTLLEPRSETEYRRVISRTIEDMETVLGTFSALLEIARLEAGSASAPSDRVDLNQLAGDLAELYEPLALDEGQQLSVLTGEPVVIGGSRELLAQAIDNLLDNAIKYTPEGGAIHLEVKPVRDFVEVIVSDSGPGIPEAERTHVLERFVRLERSRHTPGNGLGLSLVKAVARLHGAELRLEDNRPGLIVALRFARERLTISESSGVVIAEKGADLTTESLTARRQ
jgi:signal transduction histidine kinase